ncbi:type II toxin-antitoxin system HipA family toxin [uncultured Microbacterium sp.]|uniref:type II toxin-antitoxin system HipA family toxin n=1 Tax=uncultured Microbacterium sp. TaxID=191216 RepID=UPI0035C96969
MATLDLFLHDQFVGTVEPAARDRSRISLSVDRGYEDGGIVLSESFATLPGRRPPLGDLSNFLGGYVPEGNHREQMAAKRHIDMADLFALLWEFGGSIAGAVSLRRPNESPEYTPSWDELTERELEAKLKQAIRESDQGIPDDSRSTLPGYQPKVLVIKADSGWAYPHGRAHSTYILKPQVPARPTRIFDEHYSHLLTRAIGLSSYASHIHTAGRTPYLAIERFDREVVEDHVRLHHQEDLAQAMSLEWRNTDLKFQTPDWPTDPKRATARRIGELLGSIPGGDAAVEQWLRQLTFHVAIGNNDAHAKNVALMHLVSGTALSQVYDALPNLFQAGLINWDLALAVGGFFDHRRMSIERILEEAKSWGVISGGRASAVVHDTLDSLKAAVDVVAAPAGASVGMVEHIEWTLGRLLAGAEISEPKR